MRPGMAENSKLLACFRVAPCTLIAPTRVCLDLTECIHHLVLEFQLPCKIVNLLFAMTN
jgi:hypothetical protein